MDSRRLVVWIAAGILGFQGGTLVLDLLNCSVLSWLYVRRHGLELITPAPATAPRQPEGGALPQARDGGPEAGPALPPSGPEPQGSSPAQVPNISTTATPPTISAPTPFDPTGVFCDRPRSRIDAAVSQGLSILAGLALGGTGVGGGKGAP
ncbi:hypothetical protein LBMAG41_25760 [Cyanobium sp.]|nr:hypothetical protein LBMAG41_25760 [Cyanobium sp.]